VRLAQAGELERACARVDQALDRYVRSGCRLGLSRYYVIQAELHLQAGDLVTASRALAAAEEFVAASGERYTEVDLHRFKGRLLMAGSHPDVEEATAAFERALAVARAQGSVTFEQRAAASLAAHQQAIAAPAR
jgi:predicted ATPase